MNISESSTVKVLLLKVQFSNQHHQPHLGASKRYRISVPTPQQLDQNLHFNKITRWFVLISHVSKVMLKILQARVLQCMNRGLSDVLAGFRKDIRWIIETARELKKKIYFCSINYTKAFDCVDHNKLWIILKEMGIPEHFSYLLRNLYAGQESTLRIRHGTTNWFKIGKGVCQSYTLSHC